MKFSIPNLQEHILLAPYTTFNIGGSARYFVVVKSKEEMRHAFMEAQRVGMPWVVLGGGSNVLIADHGFSGLVIKAELRNVIIDDHVQQVRAEAGCRMSVVITQSLHHALSGLEFAIGVPASVGGAVWSNLGARGHTLADVLRETTVFDIEGNEHIFSVSECEYGYRESRFKHERWIIVDALFQLQHASKTDIQRNLQKLSAIRKETQDLAAKSAGCIFRNPINQTDVAAAKLIDDLGLKGKRIGGAQVSDVHANFIINTGAATAEHVVMLISYIKQHVRDNTGIQLMEEVEYIGFDDTFRGE